MKERKNKKDTTLNFRLSEQQKKKISQDAKELGLSVSEYGSVKILSQIHFIRQ